MSTFARIAPKSFILIVFLLLISRAAPFCWTSSSKIFYCIQRSAWLWNRHNGIYSSLFFFVSVWQGFFHWEHNLCRHLLDVADSLAAPPSNNICLLLYTCRCFNCQSMWKKSQYQDKNRLLHCEDILSLLNKFLDIIPKVLIFTLSREWARDVGIRWNVLMWTVYILPWIYCKVLSVENSRGKQD